MAFIGSDSVGMAGELRRVFECLRLLGLGPGDCLAQMEGSGIPVESALEAILERPPAPAGSLALARARCAATLAQGRPEVFPDLARVLARWGIHPLSVLNWDGWERGTALDLLQRHWAGPGRMPFCLLGMGHPLEASPCVLPRGLRLQSLRLECDLGLRSLPEDLEVEGDIHLSALALRRIPRGLRCGGSLVLEDLPALERWGEGIRVGRDLLVRGVPGRAGLPGDLSVGGRLRVPESWGQRGVARSLLGLLGAWQP